jgi:hypothetical protein
MASGDTSHRVSSAFAAQQASMDVRDFPALKLRPS